MKSLRLKDLRAPLISAVKILIWLTFGVLAVGSSVYLTLVTLQGPAAFAAVMLRLALIVLVAVVLLILLNVAQRVIDDRRRRRREHDCKVVRNLIQELLEAPGDRDRRAPLKLYLGHLDIIKTAGESFSDADQDALRRVLRELGAAEPLERKARESAGKWYRVQAILLLGWLGSVSSLSLLQAALHDPDSDTGYAAANALAQYDVEAAYQVLLDALGEGRLARSRLAATLEYSRYQRPLSLLINAAGDRRPPVRFWVAYLLGRSGDQGAFPALARLAGDPDANVRTNAAEALGKLKNRRAVPLVKKLLKDEVWFVRAAAAKAAGVIGDDRLMEDLLPLLRDRQWWVRQNTMLALESIGRPAVPHLKKLLDDRDRFARNKAAEALGRMGVVSEQITKLTGSPHEAKAAHDFLVAVGRAEAVDFLHEATDRAWGRTQGRLAEVLGEIGDARSLPLLEKLGFSSDGTVRDTAKQAVQRVRKAV